MIDPNCDVEVGTHPGPFYIDNKKGLSVCSRHKSQYDERADEFGPFEWELSAQDVLED